MALSLENMLLTACKTGDIETVRLATSLRVDVNCCKGWGLRRSIRYNHPQIWDSLLLHRSINVNLCNQYGLGALHTACRFNIGSAVSDLLRHPGIDVNNQTVLGSTPLMVSVKYASKQAVQILIRDKRVDLDVVDNHQRSLEDVIGVALNKVHKGDKEEILGILQDERRFRQEGTGRRLSLEEECLVIDSNHRTKVFGKLRELLEELKELQHNELIKVELRQEDESRQMQSDANYQINQLLATQEQERDDLMERLLKEKEEMDTRHKVEIERLMKKQDEATVFLQKKSDGESVPAQCSSPVQTAQSGSPIQPPLPGNPVHLQLPGHPVQPFLPGNPVQLPLPGNPVQLTQSGSPVQPPLTGSPVHPITKRLSVSNLSLASDTMNLNNNTIDKIQQQLTNNNPSSVPQPPPHSSSQSANSTMSESMYSTQHIAMAVTNLLETDSSQTSYPFGGSISDGLDNYNSACTGGQGQPGGVLGKVDCVEDVGDKHQYLGAQGNTSGSQGGGDSQPVTAGSSSPWETGSATPDEGYLTSKDQELPQIINSTCKELECPICMEVMAPPSRIWQCKMGHVICEICKERVRKESGLSQAETAELPCPTCKTAPFIETWPWRE
jgi:hypothetical protein